MYYLKFVLQFAISMGLQWGLIGLFRKKRLFHSIYELGPDTHQGKSQTPTLGGLGILVAFLVGFGLFFDVFMGNQALVWVVLVMVLFAFIGLYDDGVSLFRSKNQGLWLWHKLVLQVLISIGLIVGFSVFIRDLSWWEMGGYVFVMVGASNATNLTDGLDGLLAGCSFITLVGFTWLFQELGLVSEQLFCVLLMIGIFGFYVFNRHPARIFMGDTGSLSLGAGFAAIGQKKRRIKRVQRVFFYERGLTPLSLLRLPSLFLRCLFSESSYLLLSYGGYLAAFLGLWDASERK